MLTETIIDTKDVFLQGNSNDNIICSACLIASKTSGADLDFKSVKMSGYKEVTAHLMKHLSLKHEIPLEVFQEEFWTNLFK